MQKTTVALVFGLAGLAAGSLLSNVSSAASTSYGEDRAQIEDLQARYHNRVSKGPNGEAPPWQYKGDRNPAW